MAFELANNGSLGDPLISEGHQGSFKGWLEGLSMPDIVQLACLGGKDYVLEAESGTRKGFIYFSSGEVVHASTASLEGQDAFFEMMAWGEGSFHLAPGKTDRVSIEVPWNFLLIEALRRSDEDSSIEEEQGPTRVLIVEDSNMVTKALNRILKEDLGAEVIKIAENGKEALDILANETPDLVTLDINMPVMGGDLTLKHIMVKSPAPVVLISGYRAEDFPKVMEFLRLGAVDFIAKPEIGENWDVVKERLRKLVNHAKGFKIKNIRRARQPKSPRIKAEPGLPAGELVILVGGAGALLEIQKIIPVLCQRVQGSIVVFQDMCHNIISSFSSYLDRYARHTVLPLGEGAPLLSNQCWVTDWQGSWEIISDDNGAAISQVQANSRLIDMENLLMSSANIFREKLTVVILSGADIEMEIGLETVTSQGGRILLQLPETCLCPQPMEKIKAMELEDECFEPEGFQDMFSGPGPLEDRHGEDNHG